MSEKCKLCKMFLTDSLRQSGLCNWHLHSETAGDRCRDRQLVNAKTTIAGQRETIRRLVDTGNQLQTLHDEHFTTASVRWDCAFAALRSAIEKAKEEGK